MAKVAFIGLGVMGYPMAGHLACQGHEVTVYNRTAARALQWQEQYGGEIAATPREAALGAELVMVCVGNDDDLRSVCLGEDGAFAGMAAGTVSHMNNMNTLTAARRLSVASQGGRARVRSRTASNRPHAAAAGCCNAARPMAHAVAHATRTRGSSL